MAQRPSNCPALISLLHRRHPNQHHWWLADGGYPQQFAALLEAPLQRTDRRARGLEEWLDVFAPLLPLGAADAHPTGHPARYRYRLRLEARGEQVDCWRRYPEGIGWQRRCQPMPLEQFVRRFSAGSRDASS
jgi:hypothetical protein